MNQVKSAGTRATPTLSEPERNFWGGEPLLPGPDIGYTGHLRSEVWADGYVCLVMTDARLISPALAALANSHPLPMATRELPGYPLMSERAGVGFLGRVLVEFWTGNAPIVGAIGSDPKRLVTLTADWLKQAS